MDENTCVNRLMELKELYKHPPACHSEDDRKNKPKTCPSDAIVKGLTIT